METIGTDRQIGFKGQCHEIFCFWFFSWISFPPAPEYPVRTVSSFFENSRRYSQVKVHHRYQRHRGQICHRCQRRRRQNSRFRALVIFSFTAEIYYFSTRQTPHFSGRSRRSSKFCYEGLIIMSLEKCNYAYNWIFNLRIPRVREVPWNVRYH
jgi:hypothetical protein